MMNAHFLSSATMRRWIFPVSSFRDRVSDEDLLRDLETCNVPFTEFLHLLLLLPSELQRIGRK
ncbi:hypothetical protein WN943_013196 [Citrus x changshan-huyou]